MDDFALQWTHQLTEVCMKYLLHSAFVQYVVHATCSVWDTLWRSGAVE